MSKENNLTKIFLIVSARYQKVRMDCNVDFGQNLSCSLCIKKCGAVKQILIYAQKLRPDARIYLKTENLQVTGSFKVRGAYCKMAELSEEEKQKGVIACSAGNHAQGVALAAQKGNIPAMICIPEGAPLPK